MTGQFFRESFASLWEIEYATIIIMVQKSCESTCMPKETLSAD